MFIREKSVLMFRIFAQFLFTMPNFSRGAGGCAKCFWKFRRGGGFIFIKKKNGNSREVGGGGGGLLSEIPSVVGI